MTMIETSVIDGNGDSSGRFSLALLSLLGCDKEKSSRYPLPRR